MNLYNEIDPYCAQWLRNLIDAGEIPPGVVDERSIEDLDPDYVGRFTQFHAFCGLGGWPLVFRLAGIPASARLWSGSCPCQPFSAAGKGGGFADERHLWPAFDWLIGKCRPDRVLGEQVEGPAGRAWLDLVATDLEGHGYAFGTAVFPAAGVGAPQIRHRTYWVANRNNSRLEGRLGVSERADQCVAGADGLVSRLAGTDEGQRGRLTAGERESDGQAGGWQQGDGGAAGDSEAGGVGCPDSERRSVDALLQQEPRDHFEAAWSGEASGMADADGGDACTEGLQRGGEHGQRAKDGSAVRGGDRGAWVGTAGELDRPDPVNGFWRDSDWLYCRDDKWRPVEPGSFPLASGATARVGRLRAYGNAICVPQALAFVEAVLDSTTEGHDAAATQPIDEFDSTSIITSAATDAPPSVASIQVSVVSDFVGSSHA